MAFLKVRESKLYEEDVRKLIKAVTKFPEDDANFKKCVDFTLSNFLYHVYLDADSHKVRRSILGLYEKYLIHSNLIKAKAIQSASEKLLEILNRKLPHEKEAAFSVLALLLHLSKSDHAVEQAFENDIKINSPSIECEVETPENFDWVSYLQEGEKYGVSSDFSESLIIEDDDSFEELELPSQPTRNPPRDDSGIGASPDSCSGTSLQQFQSSNDLLYHSVTPNIDPAAVKLHFRLTYPYWIPKHQKTYGNSPYDLMTINFTKVWEEHLASQDSYLMIERKVVLHERNVVREVLWMLSGIKDLFIFNWDGLRFKVNSSAHLCSLTSITLGNSLNEFCDYATKGAQLRDFVDGILQSDVDCLKSCLTYQAYAETVRQQLQRISLKFYELEKEVKQRRGTFTILSLREKVKGPLDDLQLLYQIQEEVLNRIPEICEPFERAVKLLHVLWKVLSLQCFWISSAFEMKIVLNLFLKTCYPFFSCLEGVMFNSVLKDPYGEFIVIRKKDIYVLDEEFWYNAFQLRNLPPEIDEDFFLKPFLSCILITGKSVEMLHRINSLQKQEPFRLDYEKDDLYLRFVHVLKNFLKNKNDQKTFSETVPVKDNSCNKRRKEEFQIPKDPLLEQTIFEFSKSTARFFKPKVNPFYIPFEKEPHEEIFSNKHKHIQSILDSMEPNILQPVSISIEKALSISMKYACYPTCKQLMEALRKTHHLMRHISVFKKYFLMECGDVMFSFYSDIFEKIFYNETWQDVSFLYNTLQNAIFEDKENAQRLCLFLDTQCKDIQLNQPLSLLNSLQLSYEVEWPISIMLGVKAQTQYGQIFCFLLQIKCAKYILDKLYCTNLSMNVAKKAPFALRMLQQHSQFPTKQKIHGMYIIRMRLMFFVNGFHNYIMTRILDSFGVEFSKELENANTLEEMIAAHNLYLKSLRERCLLDPRLPYLKEQISHVLNLTHKFQRLWQSGIENVSLEDLQNIEMEFTTCNNFLISYLNKPLKRGAYPHLEALICTMLSETHVMHVFLK